MGEESQGQTEARAIEIKRQLLLELLEFVGKSKFIFSDQIVVEVIKMVKANLFRALPPKVNMNMVDADEDDAALDPAWPHLSYVYEFFLRFIISPDMDERLMRKYVTISFVDRLLELFDSEDPRERDYLKTILHRIYAKFMMLRAGIRQSINNTLYRFIYETERHNGVAELLEILGSIINGFAKPLKVEHISFLKTVLIPMHKVRPLNIFHVQLTYCVRQFVEKDHKLAVPVITGLLKYWPLFESTKQLLFLHELEEILEATQPDEFEEILPALARRIARCIGSQHFQVSERTLFYWHNEYISSLILENRQQVLPVLFTTLNDASQDHWNETVRQLSLNVLKIFVDADQSLVESCSASLEQLRSRRERKLKARSSRWSKLVAASEKKSNAGALSALSDPLRQVRRRGILVDRPSGESASQ